MTKPFFMLILLVCGAAAARAQVSVLATVPPGAMLTRDHLWNLTLVNNSRDEERIRLTIEIRFTGDIMFSATSSEILLPPGARVISSRTVEPVTFGYHDDSFGGRYLPFGNFVICYKVGYEGSEAERYSTECNDLVIAPLSPPMLNFPKDGDTLETAYPQFSWIPPAPAAKENNFTYTLLVAELKEGQSAADAISDNLPVYSEGEIEKPVRNYPASYPGLEKGHTYVWQVWASNVSGYQGGSDLGIFSVEDRKNKVADEGGSYIHMGETKGIYKVSGRRLHIRYFSYAAEETARLEFSDTQGNPVKQENVQVQQGDNYYDIGLERNFRIGEIYKLIMQFKSGKSYLMLFQLPENQN